ncbi:MAG TPA: hypothetical protein PLF81_10555 [Candidatus Anammoximicrobium sp.]|nr:hypothetical protein [Candidatus Anammoximicrobium sp.]
MTEPAARGPLRRFVNRLEVDQAVFYALCLRGWQFLAGPVSVVLIGLFFTPETQGFYYTFASLMALQTFFELGFSIVVINVSSHEWLHLRLDEGGRIVGDMDALSRLASLVRLLFRWYGIAAFLFLVLVGLGGHIFLSRQADAAVAWRGAWVGLVVIQAGLLWSLPFTVLLEGCGQMAIVNRYRLYGAVTANAAVWTSILLGAGLWTAVAAAAGRWLWDLTLLLVRYRRFFQSCRQASTSSQLSWKTDLWPMQWRLAVGGVLSYFAFSLFTPVMFDYHGPAVAGQMGMTWQLVTVIQAVALAWVQARTPLFGRLIAKQDYRELDRVFFRLTWISLVVAVVGAAALSLAVWGLYACEFRLALRLLEPFPTALFLLAIVCYHVPNCQAFYLRAHKRESLFLLGVVASLLIGAGVWWFGSRHGPTGAAWAYLAIVVCVVSPWQSLIWWQCRREHELVREENALIRANGTDPPDLPSAGPGSRVEG